MRVRDLLVETGSALDANRGRSALTVLGIVIGISAVIAMTALIGGIRQGLMGSLGLGRAQAVHLMTFDTPRALTIEDFPSMEDELSSSFEYIVPRASAFAKISSPSKQVETSVEGSGPKQLDLDGIKIVQGRTLSQTEVDTEAAVAIIDESAAHTLFGDSKKSVVGEKISINGYTFDIVGIAEAQVGVGQDGSYWVPVTTCASRLVGSRTISMGVGCAREDVEPDIATKQLTDCLAKMLQVSEDKVEECIYVYNMQSIIDSVNATMASFQVLMTTVASISLLVGGIGIMNMMLTNVTERIREIGLRKALGAQSSDIVKQFLLESVCLCLAGGVIGIGIGYLGAFALASLAGGLMESMAGTTAITPVIDISSVLAATAICIGIGVIFGFYPARRAAKLDPVESLHYQ